MKPARINAAEIYTVFLLNILSSSSRDFHFGSRWIEYALLYRRKSSYFFGQPGSAPGGWLLGTAQPVELRIPAPPWLGRWSPPAARLAAAPPICVEYPLSAWFFNIFNRNVSLPNPATGGPGLAPATYSNGLLTGGFGFVNYTAITTNNQNNAYPSPRTGQVVLRIEF